jgi:trehalose-6-phosphatase
MKGKGKTLAVDFDGTIVEHAYPEIGKVQPRAIETLKELQQAGYRLILWTCREGQCLLNAMNFCALHGVLFDSYNANTKEDEWAGSRKIYADVYIDDRMIGGFPGWDKIKAELL